MPLPKRPAVIKSGKPKEKPKSGMLPLTSMLIQAGTPGVRSLALEALFRNLV